MYIAKLPGLHFYSPKQNKTVGETCKFPGVLDAYDGILQGLSRCPTKKPVFFFVVSKANGIFNYLEAYNLQGCEIQTQNGDDIHRLWVQVFTMYSL